MSNWPTLAQGSADGLLGPINRLLLALRLAGPPARSLRAPPRRVKMPNHLLAGTVGTRFSACPAGLPLLMTLLLAIFLVLFCSWLHLFSLLRHLCCNSSTNTSVLY
jgi:hypothetical protein